MPLLSLQIIPAEIDVGLRPDAQLCYALLTITATAERDAAINWALVADASRSMRIPIVSEEQFRQLLRNGSAQEVLVDGVPVWQLSGPVPAEVRAAAPSALDFVARALHSIVDRLGNDDRFALVACAEEALVLTRSASGTDRAALARGIGRLPGLNLGEQTNLAQGITLGLAEIERSRQRTPGAGRADRLLLLTDGFTQQPEVCLQLAAEAARTGVAISTIGVGGEFQEEVLTKIADRSAGRAVFLRKPEAIPHAIAAELQAARAVAAHNVTLTVSLVNDVHLRRATRLRPALTILDDMLAQRTTANSYTLPIGAIESNAPVVLLLELLAPPHPAGHTLLARCTLSADHTPPQDAQISAFYQPQPPPTPPSVLAAAAQANAARLQHRALQTVAQGNPLEAARLLRAAATRFEALNEPGLAKLAREQAATFEQGGASDTLAVKELTYATRRLAEK